jgi:hypothetical protein
VVNAEEHPFDVEDVVRGLVQVVLRSGFAGHVRSIEQPPGRRPPAWMQEMSTWYTQLSPDERRMAEALAWRSAEYALQQTLAVLDGVIAVAPADGRGRLAMCYVQDGVLAWVTDPDAASLEELLRGILLEDVADPGSL